MTSNIFGLIVSGRLVQTDFEQIPTDPLKFVLRIPRADEINHIVLFLTGSQELPPFTGAQIYFCWPDPQGHEVWHLLGYISNDKPSAIFKISNLKRTDQSSLLPKSFFGSNPVMTNAQIGICVENMDVVRNSTPAAMTDPSKLPIFVEFTEKMLNNFVNYLGSFSGHQSTISMETVLSWYENFKRRLQVDPYFWR